MLVGELEEALLAEFPRGDAEAWDHVGLSVGAPAEGVRGVVCALDATASNVRMASARGANVLLTHHPVYIKAPAAFVDRAGAAYPMSSEAVFLAARLGVSVISLHTNLDRSIAARAALPAVVGLVAESSLEHREEPGRCGLGALADAGGLTLGALAQRCAEGFSTDPRVWGASESALSRVAFMGGSAGDFAEEALASTADALVCGECGYHVCQDLLGRGCAVVLLGHDASEEPFVKILKGRAQALCPGVPVGTIDGPNQWWTLTRGDSSWA